MIQDFRLVTIVTEEIAAQTLLAIVRESGAHGATMTKASGVGRHGERAADIAEAANVRLEVVCPAAIAARLLDLVEARVFPRFACTAWDCDVRVRRPAKF